MASLEKVRFLVVDDNLHMQEMVKSVLRGLGATSVFTAGSGDEAFAQMHDHYIDIIILDYRLGEDSGVDFMRTLRTDPRSPAPQTPVIMLTAHTERSRVEAARDAGVNEFCTKPLTVSELDAQGDRGGRPAAAVHPLGHLHRP